MRDLEDTVATYDEVVDCYLAAHADRSVVADQVERFLAALPVDAGCGPGWDCATFAERGHRPVGVDLSTAFLRAAREEAPDADLARSDMRALGVATDAVDGVWACASLLHLPRAEAPTALAEFRRVLRPDGALQLSVQRGTGTRTGGSYEGDRRRFTLYRPAELRDLVADAGFEVRRVDADDGWVALTARGRRDRRTEGSG